MKLRTILLTCTAIIAPGMAHAAPITAFFGGLLNAAGFGTWLASGAVGAWSAGFAVGSFLTGTTLGSLILNIGLNYLLTPRPSAPAIDAVRVNTRLPNAPRWQIMGRMIAGGESGVFGEHDEDGNFWYIAAHGDAEMIGARQYYFDGIPVTLSDGTGGFTAGDVLTDEFCYGSGYAVYNGTGTKYPIFRVYTVTPTVGSAYGALPAAFTTAFPDLPADFRLAGVAYSIIRVAALPAQHYGTHMRWRGAFGIGEPAVTVVCNWNRVYDPRKDSTAGGTGAHRLTNPATWEPTRNPALIWAWWRIHGFGRNRPTSEINWTEVAGAANICDATVLDRTGSPIPRYEGGFAFPDSKPRQECEQEILRTMAAFVTYDDQGRAYPVPGVYTAPTVTFDRDRDILGYQTQVVDDGESAVDGVIVEYLSPDHNWSRVESAPWVNTAYYNGVAEPNYRKIEVLGCQSHNQAVRLAKAIGLEIGAARKAAVNTTIKGIMAEGQRNVSLNLDAEFTGVFKIAGPVEEDPQGMSCAFPVVPMPADFYGLNPGEEGAPPAPTPALDIDDTLEAAANVVVRAVSIAGSGAQMVRFEATFDAPTRVDRAFRFRFAPTGLGTYEFFVTDMEEMVAVSPVLSVGSYDVSWQTVTAGGRATDWTTPITIAAEVAPVDLGDLTEPAPVGASLTITDLPSTDAVVVGDGYWWRDVTNGRIITAARYLGSFETTEYQIDQVDRTRRQVLSLTRAGSATYVDEEGVLQTAATDTPRFDYATGQRCLLVEPAATNNFQRSEEFDNAYWGKTRTTITANAAAAPDGLTTADRLVDDTTAGVHSLYRASYSFTSGAVYAMSGFFKADTLDRMMMQLGNGGTPFPTVANWRAVFDLTAGTIVSKGANVTAEIVPLAGGWYRCGIVGTAQATATDTAFLAQLMSGGTTSYTGTGTGAIFVWGGQIEPDRITSYIPTTSAAASRAADVATLKGLTATLDVSVTYGDGASATFAGQSVSPSYWPAVTQTRIRRIIGRTP